MIEKFDRLFVSTFKVIVSEKKADYVIQHQEYVLHLIVLTVKSHLYSSLCIYMYLKGLIIGDVATKLCINFAILKCITSLRHWKKVKYSNFSD